MKVIALTETQRAQATTNEAAIAAARTAMRAAVKAQYDYFATVSGTPTTSDLPTRFSLSDDGINLIVG
jgi:hypothetical protein